MEIEKILNKIEKYERLTKSTANKYSQNVGQGPKKGMVLSFYFI